MTEADHGPLPDGSKGSYHTAMNTMPAPATPASAPRLSALDGWIDVLRAGSFVDKSGRAFTVSAEDLSAIATDYATSDPAPVTIGHPESDAAPAWGWVENLRAVGDRLQAKLGRLDDSFRAACEAGRYAARSVAITPPSQNEGWKLWHLAFLGGAAPAVDGLVPSQFSATAVAPEGAFLVELAAPLGGMEERTGWRAVERMLRGLREWVIERSSIETADRVLPDWYLDELTDLGKIEMDDLTALSGALTALCAPAPHQPASDLPWPPNDHSLTPPTLSQTEPDMSGTPPTLPSPTPADPGSTQLAAGQARLDADRRALDADRLAFAAARRLSSAQGSIQAHVTAGRVLPAEAGDLTALLSALDESQKITLAAPETGLPRETSAVEILESFLSGLPRRGPDRTELSAPGSAPDDQAAVIRNGATAQSVALAAQALMSADPTGKLTIAQAVGQIMKGVG